MEKIDPQRDHINDLDWINKNDRRKREILLEKHEKKFQSLIDQQISRRKDPNVEKEQDFSNVINISNIQLNEVHRTVLSKGLKFVPTQRSIKVMDVITNVEHALSSAPQLTKQIAISEISTFIRKWKKPTNDNLKKEERAALNELKNMKNIVIVQADKGGKVVVMNKEEYIKKMEWKRK